MQFTVYIKDLVAGGDMQENRKEELVSVRWVYGQEKRRRNEASQNHWRKRGETKGQSRWEEQMDPSWEVTYYVPPKSKALMAGDCTRKGWQNLVLAVGGTDKSGQMLSAWHHTQIVCRGYGWAGERQLCRGGRDNTRDKSWFLDLCHP